MTNSLKDQLIKAGLVTKQQAHKAKQSRASQKPAVKSQQRVQRDAELAALDAHKRERDRALNAQREQQRKAKEQADRVRQLISAHAVARQKAPADTPAFHFVLGGKAHHLYVVAEERRRLAAGALGIVWFDGEYRLLPADVVRQIEELVPKRAWRAAEEPDAASDGDDEHYARFKVPDDLMW